LCNRTVPETAEGLIGGRGVGIAGCNGDQNNGASSTACAAVLFLNAMVFGHDNDCNDQKFLQVAETKYRDEFTVIQTTTNDGKNGGACDGFDGSLAVEVQLSEKNGETWTLEYVKCIRVTKDGSYVTDVECELGTIGGTISCGPLDQFMWIKSGSIDGDACQLTPGAGQTVCP